MQEQARAKDSLDWAAELEVTGTPKVGAPEGWEQVP